MTHVLLYPFKAMVKRKGTAEGRNRGWEEEEEQKGKKNIKSRKGREGEQKVEEKSEREQWRRGLEEGEGIP